MAYTWLLMILGVLLVLVWMLSTAIPSCVFALLADKEVANLNLFISRQRFYVGVDVMNAKIELGLTQYTFAETN